MMNVALVWVEVCSYSAWMKPYFFSRLIRYFNKAFRRWHWNLTPTISLPNSGHVFLLTEPEVRWWQLTRRKCRPNLSDYSPFVCRSQAFTHFRSLPLASVRLWRFSFPYLTSFWLNFDGQPCAWHKIEFCSVDLYKCDSLDRPVDWKGQIGRFVWFALPWTQIKLKATFVTFDRFLFGDLLIERTITRLIITLLFFSSHNYYEA